MSECRTSTWIKHLGRPILSPTLNAIKHVAVFAWIPLMIMWFGHGELSKVIFIALVVFYPVFFNTYDGIKNVPHRLYEVADIFQLSATHRFFKVLLPAAAPSIFAGLNIALVFHGWRRLAQSISLYQILVSSTQF